MKNIIMCLCMALVIVGCAKQKEGAVLVTLDDDKITMDEFNSALDKIPMNMKMLVATQSGKKSYLESLIVKKLILKEAKKENMDNEKEFQDRLADIREQLLIESLLKKKINTSAQLNDEELKKYYEAHKDEFKKEKEISTRHILLKTEEEAKQVQSKLQKGEEFAELAKKYSIDPNAKASGGEIGFHPKGTLLPEYEAAAFKLAKVGQVSPIVKTQFGYHIIKLEGTKDAAPVPFEEVKDFIKQKLAQEKQKELLEKYVADLKKGAKITINEAMLKEDKPAKPGEPEKPAEKVEGQAKPEAPAKKEEPQSKK
jgi:peptidyl-prolyl cis-trans isomerase C